MSFYKQKRGRRLTIGQDGNTLTMLIAVQLVIFVVLAFVKVVYYFRGGDAMSLYESQVLSWVALPADLPVLLARPWTLLTHMFVHDAVGHIIANMIWLWVFGYIFQDLTGNKKLVPLFFYGALTGAVAFILSYNIIPALHPALGEAKAIGASAGIMAIAIGATVLSPGYRIFPMINGGIPLWVVTLLFAILDLATIPYNNPGGHIAHLAGAGMGLVFVRQLQQGREWGEWINRFFDWANNLFNPAKPARGQASKTQLYYKSTVTPFKKTVHLTQQKVDEILEKIHQKGYHTLNDEEKEVLKRASKEDL